MFKTYQNTPKTIEAVQFIDEQKDKVLNSLNGQYAHGFKDGKPIIKVTTIYGDIAIVRLGDWIVKEAELGFYYPVRDDVFRGSYVLKDG